MPASIEYLGRPHIALALVSAGYASSIGDAFARFLSDEQLPLPAWSLQLEQAIAALHAHGAVPVLAHPVTIGLDMDSLERELAHLLRSEQGGQYLRGIEVYSSKHSAEDSAQLLAIAERLDLIPTGGSDYHGSNKDNVPLAAFGKGEDAEQSTRQWQAMGTASFARLQRLRDAINQAAAMDDDATISMTEAEVTPADDAPSEHAVAVTAASPVTSALGSSQRDRRGGSSKGKSKNSGTGSWSEVRSILVQLAAYSSFLALLLLGAKLYEMPTTIGAGNASAIAGAAGATASSSSSLKLIVLLARFVKANAVANWLFGNSHAEQTTLQHSRQRPLLPSAKAPVLPHKHVDSAASSFIDAQSLPSPLDPTTGSVHSPPSSPNSFACGAAPLGEPVSRAAVAAVHLHSANVELKVVAPVGAVVAPPPPPLSLVASPSRSLQQWLFCFFGLQVSYLSWGYLQERIMTVEYSESNARNSSSSSGSGNGGANYFAHSDFLVLVNRVMAFFIALAVAIVQRMRAERRAALAFASSSESVGQSSSLCAHIHGVASGVRVCPPYKYALCSLSNVLSSWFQYEALRSVSFPLQVLSKSSKIFFTMLAGRIVGGGAEGRSYKTREYVMAALIAAGLLLFRLGEHMAEGTIGDEDDISASIAQPTGDGLLSPSPAVLQLLGVLLLLGYIACDSFTSTWQSRIFRTHRSVTPLEMMLAVNACSTLFSLTVMLLFDQLAPALSFVAAHPVCLWHALLMSLSAAVGQLFIFHTISSFGAVSFASIMTARQLLSLALSLTAFEHPVHPTGYAGLALVTFALGAKVSEDIGAANKNNNGTAKSGDKKKMSGADGKGPAATQMKGQADPEAQRLLGAN
jgi:adenosine 3'-phospho 5'-phosphosulfate transporter B2